MRFPKSTSARRKYRVRMGMGLDGAATVRKIEQRVKGSPRVATIQTTHTMQAAGGGRLRAAETALSRAINDALNPAMAPSKGETLATMSPEKRAEMIRKYSK